MSVPDAPRPSRTSVMPPRDRRRLARLALLSLALLAGFYAMGLAICAALLWVPWAEINYEGSLGIVGVACAGMALYVAWALLPPLPRRNEDADPAPLPPGSHPALFAMIADVAHRVGEPSPDEVFLLPEANAFAGRRGGWLGFAGGKGTVGIGLPLLVTLDEPGVRAVIAHELGHHRAGDVRLGPLVHRTRTAIGTALARLSDSSFWLHLPFAMYAQLFLRVTRAVSREQELAADRLSQHVAGRRAAASSLVMTEHLAPRWDAYFHGEYVALLALGARLPLLEGFERFLAEPQKREDVVRSLALATERQPSDVDTHPPLAERLAAIGIDPTSAHAERVGPSALALLEGTDRAEHAAVGLLLRPDHAPLRDIGWDDVGEDVWVPEWRAQLAVLDHALSPLTPGDLARVLADPERWRAFERGISISSTEARRKRVVGTLGLWLVLWLSDRGCAIAVPPGADAIASRGGRAMHPERRVRELARGEIDGATLVAEIDALLSATEDAPGVDERRV